MEKKNSAMMKASILLIFLFLLQLITSTQVPLLDETPNGWQLNPMAKKALNKAFADRQFHVMAVGGPTRSGKSFIMSKMLEKIKNAKGTKHFGKFPHKDSQVSVTVGIDIALVEFNGKIILLLDCEGLGSLTKTMDPTLMVIMAMISQKFVYMIPDAINQTHLSDVDAMIGNRDKATNNTAYDYPLDTLYLMVNMLKTKRDPDFLNKHNKVSTAMQRAFPAKIELMFVDDETASKSNFHDDIDHFFNLWTSHIPNFKVDGINLTLGQFAGYIEKVLDCVNKQDFKFPNLLTATYEQFARNKISKLRKERKSDFKCDRYYTDSELGNKLSKMEDIQTDFHQTVQTYITHCQDVYDEFMNEIDQLKIQCKNDNEKRGNEIDPTKTIIEKEEEEISRKTVQISGSSTGDNVSKSGGMTVGGAAIGAEVGTMVPGLGNIIGGCIGGGIGAIGSVFCWEKDVSRTRVTYKVTNHITYYCFNGKCYTETEILQNVTKEY